MRTPGNRAIVPWSEIQFEDMEGHIYILEHALHAEMGAIDDAKDLLQERHDKIELLEDMILKTKDKQETLEATNDKLAFKIEALEAQIGGLQGQCAYLHQRLKKVDPKPTKKEHHKLTRIRKQFHRRPRKTPRSKRRPRPPKRRLLWRWVERSPRTAKSSIAEREIQRHTWHSSSRIDQGY
jgi:chromosome segregation ATPase